MTLKPRFSIEFYITHLYFCISCIMKSGLLKQGPHFSSADSPTLVSVCVVESTPQKFGGHFLGLFTQFWRHLWLFESEENVLIR